VSDASPRFIGAARSPAAPEPADGADWAGALGVPDAPPGACAEARPAVPIKAAAAAEIKRLFLIVSSSLSARVLNEEGYAAFRAAQVYCVNSGSSGTMRVGAIGSL